MSLEYERGILKYSKSKGASRLVLMILAYHADNNGECWPLISTIADEMNGSPSAVDRAIKKLKRLGEIAVTKRGHGRSAVYKILIHPINKHIKSDALDTNKHVDSGVSPKVRHVKSDVLDQSNTSLLGNKHVKSDVQNYHEQSIKEELPSSSITAPNFNIDFADCLTRYENEFGKLGGKIQRDDFVDIYNDLSPPPSETKYQWFEYAIKETAMANTKDWRYTRAILQKVNQASSLAKHKADRNGSIPDGSTKSTRGANTAAGSSDGRIRPPTAADQYVERNAANLDAAERRLFS